jgi:hypothetical protein
MKPEQKLWKQLQTSTTGNSPSSINMYVNSQQRHGFLSFPLHPASYPIGTTVSFPKGKAAEV